MKTYENKLFRRNTALPKGVSLLRGSLWQGEFMESFQKINLIAALKFSPQLTDLFNLTLYSPPWRWAVV